MSENVGSIYYEVDAKTDGLLKAQQDAGNITKKIANSLGLVETSTKGMSAEFKKVKAATDPAFASLVKMEKEIAVITTEFNEGRISGDQYRKTMDGLTSKMGLTAKSTTPLQKGLDTTTVKTNKMSNSIRQASMQLSQVAQQGSVTGNYMQALAIQLPDLASGFGTVGILAGALAGTLGVALIDSMNNSGAGSETLAETIDRLGNSFETTDGKSGKLSQSLLNMAEIARNVIKLRLEIEEEDALSAVKEVRKELVTLTNEASSGLGLFDVLQGVTAIEKLGKSLGITAEEAKELKEAIPSFEESGEIESYNKLAGVVAKLEGKYDKTNSKLSEYTRSLFTLVEQGAKAAQSLRDLESANNDLDKSISDSSTAEDKEGDHMAAVIAARKKEAAAVIEQTRKQFQDEQTLADEQLIERLAAIDDAGLLTAEKNQAIEEAKALHVQKLADLEKKRTADEQAQVMKRLNMKKMELAGYTQLGGQLVNLMSTIGAENSAIGKAIFLADQALAVANIIVSTQQAAAQARVLDPTGSLSASITATGYASAAIAGGVAVGQTFSGRQTGGPTEAGTPYRVGESGPELFTSGGRQFLIGGEKGNVTPNNQLGGGMSAPQVNVNVVNNTASNVSVSQEQDGNNVTIQMLVADFAEGGPVSRAMSNSYNTKRKTT